MSEIRDEAVVLDSMNFRDRDLIVALLTPNHGVVRGVFRRARGGRAPRAAAAQVLSLVRCSAFQGPQAELASIRDLDLIRSSYALAGDLTTSTAAAAIAELLLVFCPPGEPAPKPFRLARAILDALLGGVDPDAAIAYTELWLLRLGGWLARLDQCSACSSDLSAGSFTGEYPGLLCSSCAGRGQRLLAQEVEFVAASLTTSPDLISGTPSATVRDWLDAMTRRAAETGLRALAFHRRLQTTSDP